MLSFLKNKTMILLCIVVLAAILYSLPYSSGEATAMAPNVTRDSAIDYSFSYKNPVERYKVVDSERNLIIYTYRVRNETVLIEIESVNEGKSETETFVPNVIR